MRFGISSWNYLRASGGDPPPLPEIIAEAKSLDLALELWLSWTPAPDIFDRRHWPELKAWCRGLPGLSVHSRLQAWDPAGLAGEIDLCRELGADPLVVHPPALGLGSGTLDLGPVPAPGPAALAPIAGLLKHAAGASVRLALENGPPELLAAALAAYPAAGAGRALGVCLDTGHAQLHHRRFAAPPADFVRRFGPRLIHLHLSDNGGEKDEHRAPGEGAIDWPAALAALAAADYRGLFLLELAGAPPAGTASRARDFLRAASGK